MDTTQGLEGDSPEVIREQIEQTRVSLGRKLETLETEVRSSVHDASESVRERIEHVRRVFDVRHQIGEHPWVGVSAALGVGYVLGSVSARSFKDPDRGDWAREGDHRPQSGPRAAVGWCQRRLGAEGERVRALSYGIGLAFLRELVRRSLPPRIAPLAERFMGASSMSHTESAHRPE
jgi:ElaB/YqjD/DUF883 family membrane-anchored ribosome-binding protein